MSDPPRRNLTLEECVRAFLDVVVSHPEKEPKTQRAQRENQMLILGYNQAQETLRTILEHHGKTTKVRLVTYNPYAIRNLPGDYDAHRIDPPDDDLWECEDCGDERNGGDTCRECGAGRRDLREEAADREAEDRLEAQWADDPGRETW